MGTNTLDKKKVNKPITYLLETHSGEKHSFACYLPVVFEVWWEEHKKDYKSYERC